MPELSTEQTQLMLLAGMILLGWVLVRRQLTKARRGQSADHVRQRNFGPGQAGEPSHGVPLASAPPETQRWQVEMLQLQRELKAELDMKIAVLESLLRQADERIVKLGGSHRPRSS